MEFMDKKHISKMVDDLFYGYVETDSMRELKEELRTSLADRVRDCMAQGLDFEDALREAKKSLGDTDELLSGFEKIPAIVVEDLDDEYGFNFKFKMSHIVARLTPLAPFIYVLLGLTQSTWMAWLPFDLPNWWAWGWVIIPMIPVAGGGIYSIVAMSPFIYVLLGIFFGWWAWGWLIIPISALVLPHKKKKKKKKKKKDKNYFPPSDNERLQ